ATRRSWFDEGAWRREAGRSLDLLCRGGVAGGIRRLRWIWRWSRARTPDWALDLQLGDLDFSGSSAGDPDNCCRRNLRRKRCGDPAGGKSRSSIRAARGTVSAPASIPPRDLVAERAHAPHTSMFVRM